MSKIPLGGIIYIFININNFLNFSISWRCLRFGAHSSKILPLPSQAGLKHRPFFVFSAPCHVQFELSLHQAKLHILFHGTNQKAYSNRGVFLYQYNCPYKQRLGFPRPPHPTYMKNCRACSPQMHTRPKRPDICCRCFSPVLQILPYICRYNF